MKTFTHLPQPPLPTLERTEIDGKRFYVSPNGKKLPSVTTFLSHFKSDSIYKWRQRVGEQEANRISGAASRRGTKFHSMMETYLLNKELLLSEVSPDERYAFHDILSTVDRIDNIHHVEAMLYSDLIGLAGQVDCIAEFDGVLSVIDFKTSSRFKKEEWILNYFEQCTCYSLMYQDMTGIKADQIVVLISVEGEPDPQVFVKSRKDYVGSVHEKIKEFRTVQQ